MNPSVDGFKQLTDGYIEYCRTQGVDLSGDDASATDTSTADDSSSTSGSSNGAFRKSGNVIVAAGLPALAFIVLA